MPVRLRPAADPPALRDMIGHYIKGGAADNDKYGVAYLLPLAMCSHPDPRDIWRKPDPPRAGSRGKPGRYETAVLYIRIRVAVLGVKMNYNKIYRPTGA